MLVRMMMNNIININIKLPLQKGKIALQKGKYILQNIAILGTPP
jgi:hypothetical protein